MPAKPGSTQANPAPVTAPGEASRRDRVDAKRSETAILEAAKSVFSRSGVDAPIREIAKEAGVGIATLYRGFPTRTALIVAVFRREVDVCAEAAKALADERPPGEALEAWLLRYAKFIGTKQGLAAALHSGDAAYASLPDYFRQNFEPALRSLLATASGAGEARFDIEAFDLLRGIGNLATASGLDGEAHTERMVRLLVAGLRPIK